MATFRVERTPSQFVTINKTFIYDSELSFKAKGIMTYLLSRPDDWEIYTSEIEKHAQDKKDSVASGIKELIAKGYIERKEKRSSGKFGGYDYSVYEQPKNRIITVEEKPQRLNRNGKTGNGKTDTTNNNITKNNITNNDYITTTTGNPKLIELSDFYEQNHFGMMTPFKQETLLHWVDDLDEQQQGYDLVIAALKMAVKAEVLNLNYVESILRSWHNNRIFNIDDARAHEKARKNKNTPKTKKLEETKIEGKNDKRSPYDPEATYYDVYTQKELEEMAEMEGKTVEEISNYKIY